jgi:hypothetical protein
MVTTPANSINEAGASGLVNFNGTATFSTTPLVLYNVLTGAGTNTVNNVAPSTAGQVLTSTGATSQPVFAAIPFTQMPWTDEASSFAAVAGNGYFVTANATATLPASPTQGQIIAFEVDSASGILTVQANTGQTIAIGKAVSVSAGVALSNFNGDSLTLVYRASDTSWRAISVIGTFSVT